MTQKDDLLIFLQRNDVKVNTWEEAMGLTRLDLSFNKLTSLPPEIGNLTNLTRLSFEYNNLTSLPPEIGKLTNLIYLDLAHNNLTSLSPEIGKLTNLRYLWLNDNNLTSLPSEIGNLAELRYLSLQSNFSISLPPEIGLLTNLTHLYLCNTGLTSLPLGIERLPKEIFGRNFHPLYESSVTRNKLRRTISALRVQRLWFEYWWIPNEEGEARKALYDIRAINEENLGLIS